MNTKADIIKSYGQDVKLSAARIEIERHGNAAQILLTDDNEWRLLEACKKADLDAHAAEWVEALSGVGNE